MNDQLPVIGVAQNITTIKASSTTLLGRGLAALQQRQVIIADQDRRYRQARDIYDQITDFGREHRFDFDLLPKQGRQIDMFQDYEISEIQPWIDKTNQLAQVFRELKQLADEGHGKAFFPLALMYQGGQGISQNIERSKYYSQLAFNWCFDNRFNKLQYDPEIWLDLGDMYNYGYWADQDNFLQDDTEAVLLYQDAAEDGHERGEFKLGLMYQDGRGVGQDGIAAVSWCELAAEQGYAIAQCHLARMYTNGYGVEKGCDAHFCYLEDTRLEQAMFWYQRAAEQGYADAQVDLGEIYEDPLGGIDVDFEQSVFWYKKAAVQGHAKAQCRLGSMYEDGRGTDEDLEQAVFWYHQSAKQGDSEAECNLGWMYGSGRGVEQDDEKAAFWFRKAAKQGNALAQLQMGLILEYDYYSCESDDQGMLIPEEIYYWYRMAAEQGLAEAQYELGSCFKYGSGVEPNSERAMYWYLKASKQGNTRAQVSLGKMFSRGHGSNGHEINYKDAFFWFQKAAEKNDPYGQWELGICFWFGSGVKKNVDHAVYWFREAVKRGYPISQEQQKRFGIENLMDE